MKRSFFLTIFIISHIIFIFAQINNYSKIIKITYEKQKNDEAKNLLIKKKRELTHQLSVLQNHTTIKNHAIQLGMQPISLQQIEKLPKDNNDKPL